MSIWTLVLGLVCLTLLVVGVKKSKKVSTLWWKILNWLCLHFGRSYDCGCGHKAKWRTYLNMGDRDGTYVLGKDRRYCPECFKSAAIRCAWCEGIILPEDPITLYTPMRKDFKLPEGAVAYKERQVVGCLRWNCCDTGADRSGFWVMPGKVERVASPMEMALSSGEPVLVSDLGDRKKAVQIED